MQTVVIITGLKAYLHFDSIWMRMRMSFLMVYVLVWCYMLIYSDRLNALWSYCAICIICAEAKLTHSCLLHRRNDVIRLKLFDFKLQLRNGITFPLGKLLVLNLERPVGMAVV